MYAKVKNLICFLLCKLVCLNRSKKPKKKSSERNASMLSARTDVYKCTCYTYIHTVFHAHF